MLKYKWLILVLFFVVLMTVPIWGPDYILFFCLFFCLYIALAQMWNLLVGFSGLLSLGQQAFIGLSGYTVAVLTDYYSVNIWISVIMGGFLSVLLASLMSLFIFRMKGIYFAIGTWIFAEMLLLWFSNWKYVKYGTGMFIKPDPLPSMATIYYASLIMAIGGVVLLYFILRSRIGLALMAMRDDEEAAETIGVELFRSKLFCFLVGAFMTGLTAGVLYIFQAYIQPYKAFGINWTIVLLFIVIIGGIGTIEGPIVGAFVYVLLSQWLAEYAYINMLLFGLIAILIILMAPRGIMGTIHEKIGFVILSPGRTYGAKSWSLTRNLMI
jgi:branched-chain amino acid transport system permease protein